MLPRAKQGGVKCQLCKYIFFYRSASGNSCLNFKVVSHLHLFHRMMPGDAWRCSGGMFPSVGAILILIPSIFPTRRHSDVSGCTLKALDSVLVTQAPRACTRCPSLSLSVSPALSRAGVSPPPRRPVRSLWLGASCLKLASGRYSGKRAAHEPLAGGQTR